MPRRCIPSIPGEYDRIYNRGVNCQPIFLQRENHLFFLRRMRTYLRNEVQTSEVLKTPSPTSRDFASLC
jgi:hypothetical protein